MITNYNDSVNQMDEHMNAELQRIFEFLDHQSFRRILNKLTDYGEIIAEGKLSGIVNFQYKLNSIQTNSIIDLLIYSQAISKIHNVSQKGSRDLADEFVSNLFSDIDDLEGVSAFLNIKNVLENRLTHQTQQYNMNMGKANTSFPMPLSELRGHVRIYRDMVENRMSVSPKAQHGIIAASLHDAYVKFILREDWFNDRTYIKFFNNEDGVEKRETLLISGEQRLTIKEIDRRMDMIFELFSDKRAVKLEPVFTAADDVQPGNERITEKKTRVFSDKMLLTPFGKQYGQTIDRIIDEIFFSSETIEEKKIDEIVRFVYGAYLKFPGSISNDIYRQEVKQLSVFLIHSGLKLNFFAERYLSPVRKESSGKYPALQSREETEKFINECFKIYFETMFEPVFRIIRSMDIKKYACAFIIKRIYLITGEELKTFGYFFVQTIAKTGNIKL